jgi:hypothetical protein
VSSCFFYSPADIAPGNVSPEARGKLAAHGDERTTSACSGSDESCAHTGNLLLTPRGSPLPSRFWTRSRGRDAEVRVEEDVAQSSELARKSGREWRELRANPTAAHPGSDRASALEIWCARIEL